MTEEMLMMWDLDAKNVTPFLEILEINVND